MIESTIASRLGELWSLLPGDGPVPDHQLLAPTLTYPSAFDVTTAAAVPVTAATLAAAALGRSRGMAAEPPTVPIDHALAAYTGWIRRDGEPVPAWAPLSGRYATVDDRQVLVHANFAHHAEGVARRLGVAVDRDAVSEAIATWEGAELESTLINDGMICALYRTMDEWAAHPHALATAGLPLIEIEQLGDAVPLDASPPTDRALDGVRTVDCSRVLAGPVCGRTLAAHGADVLRVGAADLPSIEVGVLSTGFGKRNTFVDLQARGGRDELEELVAGAHIFLDAYRPGALASHGFGAERVAAIRPGIVVVEICAFDWVGPWAGRRGFDSIVQATTGIATAGGAHAAATEPAGAVRPVHLPFQALDYATGYLAAAAACSLLQHQRNEGGSWRARLSLLRTRDWLVSLGGPEPFEPAAGTPDISSWLHTVDSPFGRLEAVRPVAGRWDRPPAPLGSSAPEWTG